MATGITTPSLASSVSTRVDSACKHIQQCRVSQDHMIVLVGNDAEELVRNKYRYCVHTDELVLNVGKPWDPNEKKFSSNAYPRVLSNLGILGELDSKENAREAVKMIKYMYHNVSSIPERNDHLKRFQEGKQTSFPIVRGKTPFFDLDDQTKQYVNMVKELKYVHDFGATGYANTLGWAHAYSGDTMSSVMIGGLRTVQNGDFEVYCNDLIQWYWPFEVDCFMANGSRKPKTDPYVNQDPASTNDQKIKENRELINRKRFYEKEFGQKADRPKLVAYIKPFKRDDIQPRLYDWYRVFAQAISSARPHEKVDIRISRQAL